MANENEMMELDEVIDVTEDNEVTDVAEVNSNDSKIGLGEAAILALAAGGVVAGVTVGTKAVKKVWKWGSGKVSEWKVNRAEKKAAKAAAKEAKKNGEQPVAEKPEVVSGEVEKTSES